MEDCPHGLGLSAACVLCNGRDRRERREVALAKAERQRYPFWLAKRQPVGSWGVIGDSGRPLDRVLEREFAPDWRDVKFATRAIVK